MNKIVFVSDQFYPRTSADSEQIVSSLTGLNKLCPVTLLSAKRPFSDPATNIRLKEYYNVEADFSLDFIPITPNIRGFEKLIFSVKAALKVRKEDFSLVYTRNIPVIIAVLLFTSKSILFESYRPWPSRNILSRWFFRKMKQSSRFLGVVLHSEFAKKSFSEVGFEDSRLLVAHNAIDLKELDQSMKRRNELDLPDDKIIVTYSGRVSVSKGLGRLLRVAREFPRVFFLIIGSEGDGEIELEAQEMENVHVLGWMNRAGMIDYLRASDILYIPTSLQAREKAGNTVLPLKTFIYKASGTAIIAPDIADIREVLTHNETAILVEPDNNESELEGFKRLIEDKDLRERIGMNAAGEMKENTWDKRADNILTFIDSMQ